MKLSDDFMKHRLLGCVSFLTYLELCALHQCYIVLLCDRCVTQVTLLCIILFVLIIGQTCLTLVLFDHQCEALGRSSKLM